MVTITLVAYEMEALERAKRTLMPMRSDERLAQRIATDVIPKYPVASILDIGCGDGVVSDHIPAETEYLGLDINEACIYEQKHENPKVRYVKSSAIPDLVSNEGPWDMVLLFDVLEHTRDFTNLFDLAIRHSNQYVVVSLPNELFMLDRLRMIVGQELNAHSLDLIAQPDGFKHQYIININKARSLLASKGSQLGFELIEEIIRPLKPKNIMYSPINKIITKLTSDQLWSQGSIFVFKKRRT